MCEEMNSKSVGASPFSVDTKDSFFSFTVLVQNISPHHPSCMESCVLTVQYEVFFVFFDFKLEP